MAVSKMLSAHQTPVDRNWTHLFSKIKMSCNFIRTGSSSLLWSRMTRQHNSTRDLSYARSYCHQLLNSMQVDRLLDLETAEIQNNSNGIMYDTVWSCDCFRAFCNFPLGTSVQGQGGWRERDGISYAIGEESTHICVACDMYHSMDAQRLDGYCIIVGASLFLKIGSWMFGGDIKKCYCPSLSRAFCRVSEWAGLCTLWAQYVEIFKVKS